MEQCLWILVCQPLQIQEYTNKILGMEIDQVPSSNSATSKSLRRVVNWERVVKAEKDQDLQIEIRGTKVWIIDRDMALMIKNRSLCKIKCNFNKCKIRKILGSKIDMSNLDKISKQLSTNLSNNMPICLHHQLYSIPSHNPRYQALLLEICHRFRIYLKRPLILKSYSNACHLSLRMFKQI